MTWSVVEACASGEQGEQLEQRMEKETLAFDPTGLKRVPTVTLDQSECKVSLRSRAPVRPMPHR